MPSLTDEEYAQRYGAPPPGASAPQSLTDDEYEQRYGEGVIAAQARARLASRELTPEAIKANPGAPMPADLSGGVASGIAEMLGMDDGTGYQNAPLKTVDGGFVANLAANLNPVTIAKGMGTQVYRSTQDLADPFGVAHEGGLTRAAEDLRGMVPDLPAIYQESMRRGEAGESTAGMYGAPVANAVLAAIGMKASSAMKGGAQTIANADAATAAALGVEGAPLTESMATAMRGRIVSDPTKAAKAAGAAEARAIAQREAIPPASTAELGDPAAQARGAQRRTLAQEAETQGNIKTAMEALDAKNTPMNALTGAVKKGAAAGGLVAVTGQYGAAALVGKVVAIADLARTLPKTYAWKTASAAAKRSFGEAMAKGDDLGASEIGLGIATGALSDDDYGHGAAVREMTAELESLASPELRRQVLAGKRLYYTDPDGRSIEVPRNIMTALVNAPNVSEASSPVAAWLESMGKQGAIKKGGKLSPALDTTPR